jgi:putative phage-type endonuclease
MVPAPRLSGPRKLRVLQGSSEWLEARRTHITATAVPVILGLSPWKCEQDLADEMAGGNGVESTLVMRVGNALEDLIAEAYSQQTGRRVRRVRGLWESGRYPWAAASPDATVVGEPRLLELKWSGSRSRFAGGLPDDVEAQVRWQLMVAEAPVADVAALVVGEDAVRIFTVERDAAIEANLLSVAEDFRRRLAVGGPFAQSLDSLKRKYPADDGSELEADPDTAAAVRALIDVRARLDELKESEERLKVAIQTRMAGAAVLTGIQTDTGKPVSVTWKRTRDHTETDWRALSAALLAPMPEPERAALVGLHSRVVEGFRPFRLAVGKEDAS